MKCLLLFTLLLQVIQGHEYEHVVSRTLLGGNVGINHIPRQGLALAVSSSSGDERFENLPPRYRRQTGPAPPNFNFDDESRDSMPLIPHIEPPPPGSILTYDGKPISTNIGAFSIVPKTERRTPSISKNRPQYATYRGDLPPPIPDTVPLDLPQLRQS
ncbi:unnamed protein product [Orchesella dallaii]|uniref:Uncharacterized protein n=1 Tax=Orchesella dallaii TaxID=48710 RepID=A0ABP1QAL7_9HEXA